MAIISTYLCIVFRNRLNIACQVIDLKIYWVIIVYTIVAGNPFCFYILV